MSKRVKNLIVLICVICLSICLTGTGLVSEPDAPSYDTVALYVNGVRAGDGWQVGSVIYIPLVTCEKISRGAQVEWFDEAGLVRVYVPESPGNPELTIEAVIGQRYMTANGRYMYIPDGILNIDGYAAVPAAELVKAFGVQIACEDGQEWIDINTEEVSVIQSADTYYDSTSFYWLSRLISSEAGNQSLEGKIAVGNVVLNRVKDASWPDSIYDVIYDNRHAWQFSVAQNGSIMDKPSAESEIAAKLCLEGYNTAGDALYFVNPVVGDTHWFRTCLRYVISIEDHDFYA